MARRARRPLDRLRVLWKRPGWRPDDLGGPLAPSEVDRASHVKFDVPLPRRLKLYVLGQFVVVLPGRDALPAARARRSASARAGGCGGRVVLSLVSLGGLLDRRAWAVPLEAAGWRAASGGVRAARSAVSAGLLPWLWPPASGCLGGPKGLPSRPRCARIGLASPSGASLQGRGPYGHSLRVVSEVHGLDGAHRTLRSATESAATASSATRSATRRCWS